MTDKATQNSAADLSIDLFTELVACFIHDKRPQLPESADKGSLFAIACLQNLLPVLMWLDKSWGVFGDTALAEELKKTVYANAIRRHAFGLLSEELKKAGVPHLPVKGLYLAELYPIPELRTFGDIDILIHIEDRERVHRLMLEMGFEVKNDWEPTYSYVRGMELYEVHTNIMDGDLDGRAELRDYFAAAWDNAILHDGLLYEPAPEFHFIYILCHLAKHLFGGGAGMRMYLDAALFVKANGDRLNWRHIADELQGLGLGKFFATVAGALDRWFGVKVPLSLPECDFDTLERLKRFTLGADLFGHTRDRSAARLRSSSDASRAGLILRRIFPPAEQIEARYTFLKGRRWLLPAAWIARLFKNSSRLGQEASAAKRIAKLDREAATEFDRFMKTIGL